MYALTQTTYMYRSLPIFTCFIVCGLPLRRDPAPLPVNQISIQSENNGGPGPPYLGAGHQISKFVAKIRAFVVYY